MGASVSKSKRHSYGKTMKRSGRGKSMRKRTIKRGRTMKNKRRTMIKQRGGYVYSDKRHHRSTVGRGVTMSGSRSHKKRSHKKSHK